MGFNFEFYYFSVSYLFLLLFLVISLLLFCGLFYCHFSNESDVYFIYFLFFLNSRGWYHFSHTALKIFVFSFEKLDCDVPWHEQLSSSLLGFTQLVYEHNGQRACLLFLFLPVGCGCPCPGLEYVGFLNKQRSGMKALTWLPRSRLFRMFETLPEAGEEWLLRGKSDGWDAEQWEGMLGVLTIVVHNISLIILEERGKPISGLNTKVP